jgi:hypothetical protein
MTKLTQVAAVFSAGQDHRLEWQVMSDLATPKPLGRSSSMKMTHTSFELAISICHVSTKDYMVKE